jgi:hypothetical protein
MGVFPDQARVFETDGHTGRNVGNIEIRSHVSPEASSTVTFADADLPCCT